MATADEMTPRERLLAAYHGERPDRVPVSPCFAYLIPAKLTGRPFYELIDEPAWPRLLHAFDYYGADARIFTSYGRPEEPGRRTERRTLAAEGLVVAEELRTSAGTLTGRRLHPRAEASWHLERFVKEPAQELAAYLDYLLQDPADYDFTQGEQALAATGDRGIVYANIGSTFVDLLSDALEGGIQRVIYELLDAPDLYRPLQARHLVWQVRLTETALGRVDYDAVWYGAGPATLSTLSPALWREWNLPAVKATVSAAHRFGKPIHVHLHGRFYPLLEDLVPAGIDYVCPFELPPMGDSPSLTDVRARYPRLGIMGNVNTFEVLDRGTPEDVIREVRRCLDEEGGAGPYILSTADQTPHTAPEANVRTMIAAGEQYGRIYN